MISHLNSIIFKCVPHIESWQIDEQDTGKVALGHRRQNVSLLTYGRSMLFEEGAEWRINCVILWRAYGVNLFAVSSSHSLLYFMQQ